MRTWEAVVVYVEVNGLRIWHEVRGDGHPVVLLHGAFSGAASWSGQTPVLADAGYKVHVPERRGHAHTPDVPGPLTYGVMADDTVAYLDRVVGGPAHLVGWSDGAVVALLVAQRRPDLVGRLVLIGQYYNSSGKVTDGLVEQLRAGGDQAVGFLRAGYDPVSPDGPEHFPVVYAKTVAMLATEPELELASLAAVTAPTLVLQGDRDEVTLEHGAAVAAILPQGRLAVLPGTHALPVENPGVVNALLLWFLAGAAPGRRPLAASRREETAAGRIAAEGAPADLATAQRSTEIRFTLPAHAAPAELPRVSGEVTTRGRSVQISTDDPTHDLLALIGWAAGRGAGRLNGLSVTRPSTEGTS